MDNCGQDCHILTEISQVNLETPTDQKMGIDATSIADRIILDRMEAEARQSSYMAIVNIFFYYTPNMRRVRTDVPGYVNTLVAATNKAYIDSGMNVRIRAWCIQELAGFVEGNDAHNILNRFTGTSQTQ